MDLVIFKKFIKVDMWSHIITNALKNSQVQTLFYNQCASLIKCYIIKGSINIHLFFKRHRGMLNLWKEFIYLASLQGSDHTGLYRPL